jgi:hypothetical protein
MPCAQRASRGSRRAAPRRAPRPTGPGPLILKGEFEWKHLAEFFARTFSERSAAKALKSSWRLEAEAVAEVARRLEAEVKAEAKRLEAEAAPERSRDRGRVDEDNQLQLEKALAESLQMMQLSDGGILV